MVSIKWAIGLPSGFHNYSCTQTPVFINTRFWWQGTDWDNLNSAYVSYTLLMEFYSRLSHGCLWKKRNHYLKLKNPREPNLSSNRPLQYWLKTFPSRGVIALSSTTVLIVIPNTSSVSISLQSPIPSIHYHVLESITCFSICSYHFYLHFWPPWKCLDKAGLKDISELGRVSGVANRCC